MGLYLAYFICCQAVLFMLFSHELICMAASAKSNALSSSRLKNMFTCTLYFNHSCQSHAHHVHVNDSCTILFIAKIRNRPFWTNTYGNSCTEVSNRELPAPPPKVKSTASTGLQAPVIMCTCRHRLEYIAVDRGQNVHRCFARSTTAQCTTDMGVEFLRGPFVTLQLHGSREFAWNVATRVFCCYPASRLELSQQHRILNSGSTDNLRLCTQWVQNLRILIKFQKVFFNKSV